MAQSVYASTAERDGRWLETRRAMEWSGLDLLILVSDGYVERRGSVRFISDAMTYVMYSYVVFPCPASLLL
jgi:hypothetical protein